MPFACGQHQAFVYARGGQTAIVELTPLSSVRWNRIRDDVSVAEIHVPTHDCCEILDDLRTTKHELHLVRNGVKVWQGPITRIEYDFADCAIFAADILWQSTRTVLDEGYNQSYPNIWSVIDRMDWLMHKTFDPHGNPWRPVLVPHRRNDGGDPRTSRIVNAYQFYIWEDFDKYAEDMGSDYTVVNREIHYFDVNLAWKIIPPLDENYISQFPRVVEYGNQAATRSYVSNGHGYAGIYTASDPQTAEWGFVDWLVVNDNDGTQDGPPTQSEIDNWRNTAHKNMDGRVPPPVSIVIPANTTLLPGGPWVLEDLVPGAWFQAHVSHLCRTVSEYQRIHEVVVTEQAPEGETVQFSAVSAPSSMVIPPT